MIATFAIEVSLAFYVLWKHRASLMGKLAAATLLLLGTFQLAEWMVCQGALGLDSIAWAKIGFVAISFLPPLGLHIASVIAGKKDSKIPIAGYAAAGLFSSYFLAATSSISGSVCGGNYVIFNLAPHVGGLFGLYYYLTLFIGIAVSYFWAQNANKHAASALRWLIVGYTAFIAPTAAVNLISPSTAAGIPSIMCGFAVIFALILALRVLPKYEASLATDKVVAKSSADSAQTTR